MQQRVTGGIEPGPMTIASAYGVAAVPVERVHWLVHEQGAGDW